MVMAASWLYLGEEIMVERWAMLKNDVVINICLWDGDEATWQPPADVVMKVAPDYLGIGWSWDGSQWVAPPEPEPTPEPDPAP